MSDTASPAGTASTLTVMPEHVRAAGQYVRTTAQSLIGSIRTTSAEVTGLESSWHGRAATAYGSAWDTVHRGALDVFEALADMGDLLGVVVDRTAAQDNTTAGAFSSLDLP